MRSVRSTVLVTAAALAAAAQAAPRESATFTSVPSSGADGEATNATRTATLTGGYTAHRISVSGTLAEVDPSTLASEARVRVTPPGGGSGYVVQPFTTGGFVGSISITNTQQYLLPPVSPVAGTWQFRFFESFVDALSGPDATWTTITFTLDDEPAPALPTATFTESENNSNKANANVLTGVGAGTVIGGLSTGSSTTVATAASADYFRLKTAPAALGIYKHQLSLVTRLPGHGVSIRGLSQSSAGINSGTDVTLQLGQVQADGTRLVQWYGFGKAEEIYYRVTGTSNTTDEYRAVYSVAPVTPVEVPGAPFAAGAITISTLDTSTQDTDLWVYDGNLNAISGYGNDDAAGGTQSRLVRDFAVGTYYLALSTFNLANDLPSPVDDSNRTAPVMDFANGVVDSSSLSGVDVSVRFTDSVGRVATMTAIKANPFDVVWIRFAVEGGTPTCPADLDDGSRTGTPDGAVTVDDLVYFLIAFEDGSLAADLDDDGQDPQAPDGAVTIDDLVFFLRHFEAGC